MSSPALQNNRSGGTDDAGEHKYFSDSSCSFGYLAACSFHHISGSASLDAGFSSLKYLLSSTQEPVNDHDNIFLLIFSVVSLRLFQIGDFSEEVLFSPAADVDAVLGVSFELAAPCDVSFFAV